MRDMQTDFSIGELSPRTNGRIEMPWYKAGVRGMQDFIALPQGPAEARPGTVRIDGLPNDSTPYRVERMVIDEATTILLLANTTEIIAYYIKKDGSLVNAYPVLDDLDQRISIPWQIEPIDLMTLQFIQYNGIMLVVHPNYEMKELSFDTTSKSFSMASYVARYNKFDPNAGFYLMNDVVALKGKLWRALKDTPGDLTGEETYYQKFSTSNALEDLSVDFPPHDGTETDYRTMVVYNEKLWVLSQRSSADKDGNYDTWYYPVALPVNGDGVILWESCDSRLIRTKESRHLSVERPPDQAGMVWQKVCDLPPASTLLNHFDVGAPGATYVVGDFFYYGPLSTVFVCTRDVTDDANPVPSDKVTGDWIYIADAPSMGSPGMYPNSVVIHDRRIFILGTKNKPGIVYASCSEDIHDLTIGINADDGMQIELNTEVGELPSWGRSRRDLIIGASKSEWIVTGGEGPITPQSMFAFPQSRSGSMRNGAVDISDMLVFFQKGGQRLLRFVFSNDTQTYATPDMSQLSEHIFEKGVVTYALQSNPDFILWCVMQDGTLVGGTYNPQTQTFGWHNHVTDGKIESIEVTENIFGEDEIWLTVHRVINGADKRVLEKFAPRKQLDSDTMIYVDDAEVIAVTDGVGYASEDKWGRTMTVLYGGAAHPDVVVGADGRIEFQHALFDSAVIGTPYYPTLKPQKLYPSGSRLDVGIRISRCSIRVYKTLGIEVGANDETLDPVVFRSTSGIMGQAPPLYSGEVPVSLNSSFGDEEWMMIKRTQPFPCMILGITYELEMGAI